MSFITTLIPAYKSTHLGELFLGLKTQTLRDFRVVLSDDSPGGEISDNIRRGVYDPLIDNLDLVVVQGPRRGAFKNIRHLLMQTTARQGAALVHLHMDDDVIYPDFYRLHAMTHASAALGATVSQRWLAAADGRPIAQLPLPELIEQQAQRIVAVDAPALYGSTIPWCRNWLGEFSNVVLAPAAVQRLLRAEIGGLSYYGLADIGVLLDVAQETPIGFIHDHLGVFRSHPAQSTAARGSHGLRAGYLAWAALALGAHRIGRLDDAAARRALQRLAALTREPYAGEATFTEFFALLDRHENDLDSLHAHFAPYWQRLLQADTDSCDEPSETAESAPA
jgi:hypothetical protein